MIVVFHMFNAYLHFSVNFSHDICNFSIEVFFLAYQTSLLITAMLFLLWASVIGSKHLSCLSLKVTFNNTYEILK